MALAACSKKAVKPGPFDAETEFNKANKLLESKKFDDARLILNDIKSRDAGGRFGPLAQLRLADSYLKEEQPEIAVEEYRRFIELYIDHKYAPYAQYQTAMSYFGQIEDKERGYDAALKALKEFEDLKERFPRNPYSQDVEEKIAKCREIIADYEYMVGDFYFRKKAYKGAIERLKIVIEQYPGFKDEAEVLYRLAVASKELGDEQASKEYFGLLSEKYPQSKAIEKAKKALSIKDEKQE